MSQTLSSFIVSFVAWIIRTAVRKLMQDHYASDELSGGMRSWFNNLNDLVSRSIERTDGTQDRHRDAASLNRQ
jgi:hypothetical protein